MVTTLVNATDHAVALRDESSSLSVIAFIRLSTLATLIFTTHEEELYA
jgi:hypothetical protein